MADDIFKEVEEQMRQERMNALWKKFGPYILGIAALILLTVVGVQYYQKYTKDIAAKDGQKLIEALDIINDPQMDNEQGMNQLVELVENGSNGYPTIAKFRLASEYEKDSAKHDAAITLYSELSKEAEIEEMKSLATIRKAYLEMDRKDYASLQADLSALHGKWIIFKDEILGAKAYEEKDFETAMSHFDAILTSENASSSVTRRANEAMSLLVSKGFSPNS